MHQSHVLIDLALCAEFMDLEGCPNAFDNIVLMSDFILEDR